MKTEKEYNELLKLASSIIRNMGGIYSRMAKELAAALSLYRYRQDRKVWVLNGAAQDKVDAVLAKYQPILLNQIKAGTVSAWQLSELQSNKITKGYKSQMPDSLYTALTSPNADALEAFLNNRRGGLNISERVWNLQRSTKRQIEAYLSQGLSVGKSSASMARDLEKYLNRSDISFVNNSEYTEKKRSRPAKDLKPGRGVYKSSFKNAMRLARTEVNMAYRSADTERRKQLPFVTGIQVKLSASHPEYDICDQLKGEYPKGFEFIGWHPNCLCYSTAKLMTAKEYGRFRKGDFEPEYVKNVPAAAKKYLDENEQYDYKRTA